MSVAENLKSTAKRLRLDSHHEIERFGLIFTILAFMFTSVLVGAGFSAHANKEAFLDSTALYNSTFVTSKTGLKGDVEGVYTNSNKNRAMVLMSFDKANDISSSAENYQAFLTGSTFDAQQKPLASNPQGSIIVFGSTGYVGVLLENADAFPQQILNLTLRANAELVPVKKGKGSLRQDFKSDSSFVEFDQWRVYFNPAAEGTIYAESLDGDSFSAGKFYAETVTKPEEDGLRDELEETLVKMKADLNVIDEYESQLGRTASLDGDYLAPPRGENPQEALIPIAGDEVVGEEAKDGEPSTLELKTDWVAANGFDFDWRDGSVQESYLDGIVPAGEKYGVWLAEKAQQKNEGFNSSNLVWSLTDGDLLADAQSRNTTTVMAPLVSLKTKLEEAYRVYYDDKINYQVKLPMKLLELDVVLRNVESAASVNTDESALLTY